MYLFCFPGQWILSVVAQSLKVGNPPSHISAETLYDLRWHGRLFIESQCVQNMSVCANVLLKESRKTSIKHPKLTLFICSIFLSNSMLLHFQIKKETDELIYLIL